MKTEYKPYGCLYCKRKMLIKAKVPKGKRKYKNQKYLQCVNCGKTQMIMVNSRWK